MQVTGLRRRYFIIILIVLTIVTIATLSLHNFFLQRERLSLIDQQVREAAVILIESDLGELRTPDIHRAEDIISEELGDNRIGKFFIIRKSSGEILFKSSSANLLPFNEIPEQDQWVTLQSEEKFIRVLNLKVPRIPDRTLQIGLVIDKKIVSQNLFATKNILFITVEILLGLVVALLLTSALLRPIQQLTYFIKRAAEAAGKPTLIPEMPDRLKPSSNKKSNDEFQVLVTVLDLLINRVNEGYKNFRHWTFQMAHELKTPTSTISILLENALMQNNINKDVEQSISNEIARISNTITAFLSWAEVENAQKPPRLHANRISFVLADIVEQLKIKYPERIQLHFETDFFVFSNPHHLEQSLRNTIENALSYSTDKVDVYIKVTSIEVKDYGKGIPIEVLERIGEPFNRGQVTIKNKGHHGLGLAWIHSVAKLYNWRLKIASNKLGTSVEIEFEKENCSTAT